MKRNFVWAVILAALFAFSAFAQEVVIDVPLVTTIPFGSFTYLDEGTGFTLGASGGVQFSARETALTIEGTIANIADPLNLDLVAGLETTLGLGIPIDLYMTLDMFLDIADPVNPLFGVDGLEAGFLINFTGKFAVGLDTAIAEAGGVLTFPFVKVTVFFGSIR